jgi:hypothetical protein
MVSGPTRTNPKGSCAPGGNAAELYITNQKKTKKRERKEKEKKR